MRPATALLCLPALSIVLAAGVMTQHVPVAMVVSSGALSVGFGAFQQFTRHRGAPMTLAAIGMSVSAGVGSLAGGVEPALLMISAAWAGLCGWLTIFGGGAWWIAVQWTIALFVAAAFPADLTGALSRSGLVFAGGLLQILIVTSGWRVSITAEPGHKGRLSGYLRLARRVMRASRHPVLYAIQSAVAVIIAILFARGLRLPNGYWAPMTALLVIKPEFRQTLTRGFERAFGTLAGAGVATLAASTLRPREFLCAILTVIFAWCAYAIQKASYALFTASITACIVFLLALTGLPEPLNALHRIIATAIGAAIALAVGAASGAFATMVYFARQGGRRT